MSAKIDLKALIANPPKLHDRNGELISNWRIDDTTVFGLDQRLKPGMKTLETGAGLSTIIFAANGCEHTCIVPDQGLIDRIIAFCKSRSISTDKLQFIVAGSTDAIYILQPGFDLVLIDGTHGFPAALVDFYYATKLLKIGGTLIIDDMHIYTCKLIATYMKEDRGWHQDLFTDRVAFGTKIAESIDDEWVSQPFVMRRSAGAPGLSNPLKALQATTASLREKGIGQTFGKIAQRLRQSS